jgi:hypothetical protein
VDEPCCLSLISESVRRVYTLDAGVVSGFHWWPQTLGTDLAMEACALSVLSLSFVSEVVGVGYSEMLIGGRNSERE